jgi:hypothetical protein
MLTSFKSQYRALFVKAAKSPKLFERAGGSFDKLQKLIKCAQFASVSFIRFKDLQEERSEECHRANLYVCKLCKAEGRICARVRALFRFTFFAQCAKYILSLFHIFYERRPAAHTRE